MKQINSLKALNTFSDDVSKSDLFSIAPELLIEEEGFNSRGAFTENYFERPEVAAHIRSLADAYKAGRYVPPIVVKVRNADVLVRDGHCRRRAILLAKSEGADIKKIQVLEIKGDEAAQAALIVTSNDGMKLSQLERAVIYGRLAAWGWSDAEIAQNIGRTAEHVRQLRSLLELPLDLKRLIQDGAVSSSYAAELYAMHGEAAIEMVRKGLKESGKQKITKKNVSSSSTSSPRIGKKLVEAMRTRLATLPLDNLKVLKMAGGLAPTKPDTDTPLT